MHGMRLAVGVWMIAGLAGCSNSGRPGELRRIARIPMMDGEAWTVAHNPDLGELTRSDQQPVDFGIWQAGDGTWQIWSCIRGTKAPGKTRLFHRWEGRRLTDRNWRPMGVAMQADPAFGETPGGLQAPYVWREDAPLTCGGGPATQPAGASRPWVMAYGDWVHLCLARSDDGKHFERCLMPDGRAGMFDEGPESNARDAMVIRIDRERDGRRVPTWYCYYTAHPGNVGAVYCRTSTDLRTWSASRVVARGGRSGTEFNSAECPFVVVMDGYYYLFRTQRYGEHMLTNVYRSTDPLDFGVDSDAHYIQELPVAAPEVFEHDGRWYIAHLRRDLKGIQIAPLRWDEDRRSEQGGGT